MNKGLFILLTTILLTIIWFLVPSKNPLTQAQQQEDFQQLKTALNNQAAYWHKENNNIFPNLQTAELTVNNLAPGLAIMNDPWLSIKNSSQVEWPFEISFMPFQGKLVGVKFNEQQLQPYNRGNSVIKDINNFSVEEWQNRFFAPGQTLNGFQQLQFAQYLQQELAREKVLTITFDSKLSASTIRVYPSTQAQSWLTFNQRMADQNLICDRNAFEQMVYKTSDNLAVIRLPAMYQELDCPEFFSFLNRKMSSFQNVDGVLVDVRNNQSGNDDLIKQLMPYFMNKPEMIVSKSLIKGLKQNDLLTQYDLVARQDNQLSQGCVDKIEHWWPVSYPNFDDYFYILLGGQNVIKNLKSIPLVLLVNEKTQGYATDMATALHQLPQVTVVGESAGPRFHITQNIELTHSKIKLQFSQSASLAPNDQWPNPETSLLDNKIESNISDFFSNQDHVFLKAMTMLEQMTQ